MSEPKYSKEQHWRELEMPWFIGWSQQGILQVIREIATRSGHRILTSDQVDLFRDTPLSDRLAGSGRLMILRLFEQGRRGFVDVAPDLGLVGFSSCIEFEIPEEFVDDEAWSYETFTSAEDEHHWRRLAAEIIDAAIMRSFELGAILYGRPESILAPFLKIEHDQWAVLCRSTTDWTILIGPAGERVYSPHFMILNPAEVDLGSLDSGAAKQSKRANVSEARVARELLAGWTEYDTRSRIFEKAQAKYGISKNRCKAVWKLMTKAEPRLSKPGNRPKSNPPMI